MARAFVERSGASVAAVARASGRAGAQGRFGYPWVVVRSPRPPGAFAVRLRVAVVAALAGAVGSAGCQASRPPPRPREAFAPPRAPGAAVDAAMAAEVAALASPDFEVRSRAAEALVARGEAALPALGSAGDLPVEAHGKVAVSATRPVIAEILAQVPEERVARTHLAAAEPAIRRGAADEIGRRGGWGPVPDLIDRLEDDDAGVRAAVVAALRRLTNRVYDVAATDAEVDRTAAAARWREWWNREGRRVAADPARRPG